MFNRRNKKLSSFFQSDFLKKNLRGQIWVETLIYTLIAFVMIGLVLFFAGPKISEIQDKAIIEQSIEVMGEIDTIISGIGTAGNRRVAELRIRKGALKINGTHEKLVL